MRWHSGLFVRDRVGDRLQHHRLAGLGRRDDEAALALADRRDEVDDPRREVLVSVSSRSRSCGYSGVSLPNSTRLALPPASAPLMVSRRTSALNFWRPVPFCGCSPSRGALTAPVTASPLRRPYLLDQAERDVDVVGAGQVAGGADEGVVVEHVEDAGHRDEDVVVGDLELGVSYSCAVPVVPRLRFRSRLRCRLRRRPPRASSSSSRLLRLPTGRSAPAGGRWRRLAAAAGSLAVLLAAPAGGPAGGPAARSPGGPAAVAAGGRAAAVCRTASSASLGSGADARSALVGGRVRADVGESAERRARRVAESDRCSAALRRVGGSLGGLGRPRLGPGSAAGPPASERGALPTWRRADRLDEVALAHLRRAGDAEARREALELDDVHRRQGLSGRWRPPVRWCLSRRSFPLVVGAALVGGTGVGRRCPTGWCD